MAKFNLDDSSIRLILHGLDDKSTVLLRKIDNLRKMKGSIDDELYDSINIRYQEDLQLLEHTVMIIEAQW